MSLYSVVQAACPKGLRTVVSAALRTGRGSVLGPDTARRARWWQLTLTCGHVVERTVRYQPSGDGRLGSHSRNASEVLPAPKCAKCDHCST